MRIEVAVRAILVLVVVTIASACSGVESAPQRSAPAPGELTSVGVEVHEAPG